MSILQLPFPIAPNDPSIAGSFTLEGVPGIQPPNSTLIPLPIIAGGGSWRMNPADPNSAVVTSTVSGARKCLPLLQLDGWTPGREARLRKIYLPYTYLVFVRTGNVPADCPIFIRAKVGPTTVGVQETHIPASFNTIEATGYGISWYNLGYLNMDVDYTVSIGQILSVEFTYVSTYADVAPVLYPNRIPSQRAWLFNLGLSTLSLTVEQGYVELETP